MTKKNKIGVKNNIPVKNVIETKCGFKNMNNSIRFLKHVSPIDFGRDLSFLYAPKTHTFLDETTSRTPSHFKHKIKLQLYVS